MDGKNTSNPYGPTSVIEPNNIGTVQDVPIQPPSPSATEMYTQPVVNATISDAKLPLNSQVEQISSSYESLDGSPEVTTSLVSAPTVRGNPAPLTESTPSGDASRAKPPVFRDKDTNKLLFRLIAGASVVFFVLFGAGLISSRLSDNRPVDPVAQLEEQEISGLTDQQSTLGVQTSGSTLLVNGNVLATDSLQVSSDGVIGSIVLTEGAGSQTYTLPNSSGVFCLDINNCNYLQADDVTTTSVAGVDGALSLGAGLTINGTEISSTITQTIQTSVNGSVGSIVIQGTTNQVGVSRDGNTITLTSPQDIGLESSPTFSSITLSGIGTQNGNVLCDISNNCGYAGGTGAYIQDGNSFGVAAVLGTNDNFSLAFETNGVTQATLAVGGAFTLQNSVDSTSGFRVMDADGGNPVLNVDTSNERVGIGTAAPSVELDVAGDTVISNRLQVGPTGNSIDQCTTVFFGAIGCDVAIDVANTATDPNLAVYGIYNNTTISPTGANIATNYGSSSNLLLNGTNNFTASNIGVSGAAVVASTAGTVSRIIGVDATAAILTTTSTATVTDAIGMQTGVGVFSTVSGGTITTGYGLQVASASVSGAGASIGTNYGIYVNPQTAGTTDYGVAIGAADTQTLWLSSNADNTSASAGIAFGSSRDTNLYRSAANTLRTDDALSVGDDITVTGDILPSADDTYDLGSNSNRWRDLYLGPATLSIGTSATDYKISYDTGNNALLFNNDQDDRDFRIAGDTQANLLYVDAGNNRIGIGTSTPGYELDVVGTINASTGINVNGTQVCTASGCIAAPGSGNYIQNGTSIQTNTNFAIQSAATGSVGAVIRGASGQTAALQEWQNSSGTVLASVLANGTVALGTTNVGALLNLRSATTPTGTPTEAAATIRLNTVYTDLGSGNNSTGAIEFGNNTVRIWRSDNNLRVSAYDGVTIDTNASSLAAVSLKVKAVASQSGDLQQWQNSSGTRLTSIESTGSLYSPTAPIKLGFNVALQGEHSSGGGFVDLIKRGGGNSVVVGNGTADTTVNAVTYLDLVVGGANGVRLGSYNVNKYGAIGYLGSSSAFWNALWLQPVNATSVAGTIRAQASQSANLMEWQSSAGTVLTAVDASGNLLFDSGKGISTTAADGNLYIGQSSRAGGTGGKNRYYGSAYYGGYAHEFFGGSASNMTGVMLVTSSQASKIGLTVKGAASQTGNLQEWQDSSGTVLAYLSASGNLAINHTGNNYLTINSTNSGSANLQLGTAGTGPLLLYDPVDTSLQFQMSGATRMQLTQAGVLKLNNTGLDDRLEFVNSGISAANIIWGSGSTTGYRLGKDASGYFRLANSSLVSTRNLSFNGADGLFGINTQYPTTAALEINVPSAANLGLIVRGAASQTASLQEWQNSSGTTLLRVNQNGTIQNITGNANAFLSSTTLGLAGGGGIQVQSGSDLNLTTSGVGQIVLTTGGSARFRVTDGGVAMVGSSGTAGTVEKFRVNTPTTVDNLAATILSTGATTSKGLVVQGAASQTANLQEWQDSSGTILTRVNADGSIALGGVNTASTGALRLANNTYIYARNAANTGNKQLLGYDSADNVVLGGSGTSVNVYIMNAIGSGIGVSTTAISSGPGKGIYQTGSALGLYHYNGNITLTPGASSSFASVLTAARSGTNITVQTAATTDIGLVVKGTASQTANLQEWQDSTGSVLASVGATGNISITNADTPGTRIMLNQTNPNFQAYLQTNYTGNSQGYRIGQSNSTGPEFFVQSTQSNNYFIRGGYNNMAVVIGPSADQRAAISDYGSNSAATLIVQDSRASVGATRLVVRAGAGQSTTNLQEWQNSAGTVLTSISANGILNVSSSASGTEHDLGVNQGVRIGTFARFGSGSGGASAGAIRLFNNTFVNWRNAANSADIGIRVDTNNTLQLGAAATTLDTVADTTIGTSGTTRKGLVIQGVASQTASLQEWQSSTGTVLASIAADGDLEVVDATVNGNLVVDGTATFNGNITVNGHVITGNTSGSTTVTVNTTGAGTGASASISGNDTAGVITINTGTGAAAGTLATVTFANAFGSAPEVIITPKSIPGGGTFPQYHFDSATTTFDLKAFNALTDSSTYTFTYMIVE